jgi:nitrogen fixation protein NifU and related proteins
MDLYKEEILDHYKNPHNFGDLSGKTHQSREMNASCGDMIEIYLKIDKGVVVDAGFRGVGCALSTAAASLLTDEVKGKMVEEVVVWDKKIIDKLMGEVNPGRVKCVTLPLEVLQKAIACKIS